MNGESTNFMVRGKASVKKKICFGFLILYSIACGAVYLCANMAFLRDERSYLKFKVFEMQIEKIPTKKFAYYVLSEECLPKDLLSMDALGNSTYLDVYVNSFRKPCESNNQQHITYIHDNQTTWTTGRNLLLYHVKKLKKQYVYHIFLDDDVLLFYTEHMAEYSKKGMLQRGNPGFVSQYLKDAQGFNMAVTEKREDLSAWRSFELDLITQSPAFSTVNYVRNDGFESYLTQQKYWSKMCAPGNQMPWITTTYFLDALMIAYHEQAIPLLLPYSPLYDSTNWWISAILQIFRARAILHRQCVCNYRIAVVNRAHRPYPHRTIPDDFLKKYIEKEAPELARQIDIREMDYKFFHGWSKFEEVFFADPSICLEPLKFPIADHYRVNA